MLYDDITYVFEYCTYPKTYVTSSALFSQLTYILYIIYILHIYIYICRYISLYFPYLQCSINLNLSPHSSTLLTVYTLQTYILRIYIHTCIHTYISTNPSHVYFFAFFFTNCLHILQCLHFIYTHWECFAFCCVLDHMLICLLRPLYSRFCTFTAADKESPYEISLYWLHDNKVVSVL